MQSTNKHGLPDIIERAVLADPYDNGGADISTTQLINPPQLVALSKRHKDKIQEDISERLWSMLGQALHVVIERAAGQDMISEQRYFADVLGWKVSGAVDIIQGETLFDLKCTSVWTLVYGSRMKEWTEQGNINHWLYHKTTGKHVTSLKNILFLRDWVASKYKEGSSYPPVQVVTVNLPLWPLEKAEKFVEERVLYHQVAADMTDDMLEPCTDEERWWNEKNKAFIRCQSYCPVRSVCHQFNGANK